MAQDTGQELQSILAQRYVDSPDVPDGDVWSLAVRGMAARGSCRAFLDQAVPIDVLETLCAVALAAPSKSDLQQRDIVLVTKAPLKERLAGLVSGQQWVAGAPTIAVFCGNNRRQRQIHDTYSIPFANDHLDAFFNATVDGAIALAAFVTAAEAVGLGCCPISAIRNEAEVVSDLLGLPQHVFPIAGLAIGYPAHAPQISKRLPLATTVHHNQFSEAGVAEAIQSYDADRTAAQPYAVQRFPSIFGEVDGYGWSMDKVRQYSQPERAAFGKFIRAKGFKLD